MDINTTQRNATRNQSTADYEQKKIFIFDNRFQVGIYKNTLLVELGAVAGMLVVRSKTVANGYETATADNLADVIGILAHEGTVTLAASASVNVNICTKGTIDGKNLSLPATITLNTVVGNKTLRDILEGLGFHVDISGTEHTTFDN